MFSSAPVLLLLLRIVVAHWLIKLVVVDVVHLPHHHVVVATVVWLQDNIEHAGSDDLANDRIESSRICVHDQRWIHATTAGNLTHIVGVQTAQIIHKVHLKCELSVSGGSDTHVDTSRSFVGHIARHVCAEQIIAVCVRHDFCSTFEISIHRVLSQAVCLPNIQRCLCNLRAVCGEHLPNDDQHFIAV